MATGTYAPWPAFTGFNNSGDIIPSGKVFTYLAGTTTKVNTFTDVALSVANTNPIILDSAGRATIFLTPGVSYKFVLSPSTDTDPPTNPIWTRDNISTVPPFSQDVDITATAGENLAAADCVYMSIGTGADAARTAGRWYKADQSVALRSTSAMVGFATAAITSGNSGTVRIGGLVTGLSALTIGGQYRISTTPGALTSTFPDASYRTVGIAQSTTTLILSFPWLEQQFATLHTDGSTLQSGLVGNLAQTWSQLKTFQDGLKDSHYTKFLAADATNATTTMSNLTDLSITLVSGFKYGFELVLQMSNSTAADGMKIDFDGGAATMTNFRCSSFLTQATGAIVTLANGVATAIATDINVGAMATTAQHMLVVMGSIEPSSSNTFIPRFAMNAATTGTLTVFRGSFLKLRVM